MSIRAARARSAWTETTKKRRDSPTMTRMPWSPRFIFLIRVARTALAIVPEIPSLPKPGPPDVEDKFSVLSGFDTVFLVDDLPSMNGQRWKLVNKILDYDTAVATSYNSDGIDVQFFNNTTANQDNIRDEAVAVEIHRNMFLKGNPPIRDQLSRHRNNCLRKYHKRPEDDLNHNGYNLIVLTDGEPNPEREDGDDISDHEDAKITKSAFRMIRKLIVDVAHALDEEGG